MSEQEIIEGNKLIAEFMGYKEHNHASYKTYEKDGKHTYEVTLQYYTKWEWLMPVVQKIYSLTIHPNDDYYHALSHYKHNNYNLFDLPITADLRTVYKYVIEFIKWYNQQSNP